MKRPFFTFNRHLLVAVLCGSTMGLVAAAMPEAEAWRFRRFSDEEGLPNNLFREIIQDRDGLLWMFGIDGLASFDGYTVKAYRHDPGDPRTISGNNIRALCEDGEGRLWVGTIGAGLSVSDKRKRTFTRIPFPHRRDPVSQATVYAITADADKQVWVATDDGLWVARMDNGDVSLQRAEDLFPLPAGASPMSPVSTLMADDRGRVFVGTSCGLYVWASASGRWQLPHSFPMGDAEIQDFTVDRNGGIWASCTGQQARLYRADPARLVFVAVPGIPFASPTREVRIVVDHDNRLWAASFGEQCYVWDLTQARLVFQSTMNADIAHERFFRKPFVDHSGDVWLPCEGFYIFPFPRGFMTYRHPLVFHQSNTAVAVIRGERWFAYREQGIIRVDPSTAGIRPMSSSMAGSDRIPYDHIQQIVPLADGHVLLVGFGAIMVLDVDGRCIRTHVLSGTNRAALEDSRGRIWIGGIAGLHRFDIDSGVVATYVLPPSLGDARNFIQAIQEDDHGRIWFGSDLKGLAMLEPRSGHIVQHLPEPGNPDALPSFSVIDMARDRVGALWLATDAGLVRLDPRSGRMRTFDRHAGLSNDYITAVVCAPDGRLWVSTHDGIAVFDPGRERFVSYGRGDGLSNASYYPRSRFIGPDGRVYFGGRQGVDHFDPSAIRANHGLPRMCLSSLRIDGAEQDVSAGAAVQLDPGDKLLEIEFAGLYFTDQAGVRYAWRMDGGDTAWVDLGQRRQVVFASLKPGTYTFRARAFARGGRRAMTDLVLPFSVRPPFYATLWFRGSMTALALLAGLAWVRRREAHIRAQDRRDAEIARQMAELEKRALQSQMNPHFIYNAMNSIQQFMLAHDVEGAMRYLTRFSRILRTVLNLSAQSRVPLTDEIRLIEDYLELENMRFPNRFSYRIDVDPDLPVHAMEIPPFLVQPQVENAIRHGLLNKGAPGHLEIRFRPDGRHLRITVEDDGIGRQAAGRHKREALHVSESRGLAIVRERLTHLHAGAGEGTFTITDLHDAAGEPAGTRVEILIPLE